MSTNLLFLAPVLVTLALKVDSPVRIERAPASLALVAGNGTLVSMVGNPFFGRMSDRTASPLGMRRPWMVPVWWAVPSGQPHRTVRYARNRPRPQRHDSPASGPQRRLTSNRCHGYGIRMH